MTNDITLLEENDIFKIWECPVCGIGRIKLDNDSPVRYSYCDSCGAAYIDYVPLPHQMEVHKDNHKLKLLIGGMGSAKSRCAVNCVINHALTVKNGRTVMFAQTLKQLSKAIMPIFKEYLPDKFIAKWTDTKADISIQLTNGHEIIGFASDDEEKLRSLDITCFYLEEASGIKPALYQECIRRLRNKAAIINGKSYFLGLIVSNPSQGFIRDLLFTADKIEGSQSIKNVVKNYRSRVVTPNIDLAAFLSSSRDNPHLPKGFIQSVINSLTPAQVRLYVDCIIEYAEGAVYPDFMSYLEDDFAIPKNWVRWIAHDPGIHDPAAILLGALDPETHIIHFYREYYHTDKVLDEVAQAYDIMTKDIPKGYLRTPLIDPAANKRSTTTGKTYKQQFAMEHGVYFKDANNDLVSGISKVRNMMYKGRIRFFRSLSNTIKEGCEYRYPTEEERNKNRNLGDIPYDKYNHLMDCLRYICQDLPYDMFGNYSASDSVDFFEKIGTIKEDISSFSALSDYIRKQQKALLDKQDGKAPKKSYAGGYKVC